MCCSLTTGEFARLLNDKGHEDLMSLDETEFDDPLGEATGAGGIFGEELVVFCVFLSRCLRLGAASA
jgi:iron only hydrogenase large subunit-like protein